MPIEWPPAYTLRQSTRARYVQLKITKRGGLEVIAPPDFELKYTPDLLQRHRRWIEKVWERTKPIAVNQYSLPEQINIPAIEQTWQVFYEKTEAEQVYLRLSDAGRLVLQGNVTDFRKCQLVLCHWLRKMAAEYLLPWLAQLSVETGLNYTSGKTGSAATRWGSCSEKKRITLNWHILFLPKALARHLLVHELCHTIVMDHSVRFWNLLAQHDANSVALRKELRLANKYLPDWIGEK